jgi:formate dehydrogenase major subunit
VAVVGSGPAGLAAAYNLRLSGHEVHVFDDKPAPGGYLRTGIPEYRLPRPVLDREVGMIERLGVVFHQRVRVGRDISFDALRSSHDAVILALGLHRSRALGIPGEEHPQVYNGVKLLEQLLAGERPPLPRRMAVVGGGNTAMDVARSLLRVGVEPVVVYRRTRAEMPAIASEVEDALAEGVPFEFLAAPVRVLIENGAVVGLECQRMQLGEPDASGRRRPLPIPGSEFVVPCQGVVTALGEEVDLEGLPSNVGAGDARQAAALPGVFVAGDMADGAGTVTAAVGSGIRVAAVVHAYLQSGNLPERAPAVPELWPREVAQDRKVEFENLNTAYLRPAPRPAVSHLPPEQRRTSFSEVVHGWSEEAAVREAGGVLPAGPATSARTVCTFAQMWPSTG